MTRTYETFRCFVCDRRISVNGFARTNHMRKHVRDGTATEVRTTSKVFRTPRARSRGADPTRTETSVYFRRRKPGDDPSGVERHYHGV